MSQTAEHELPADSGTDPADGNQLFAEQLWLRDLALENSRDGVNVLDLRTGKYVYMNPAQVALTGFSAEEMNELPVEEAYARVHPDDRHISVEQQRQVASGALTESEVEYRWQVKSGEYRWFSDRRRLVRDSSGQPVYLVGASRDPLVDRFGCGHRRGVCLQPYVHPAGFAKATAPHFNLVGANPAHLTFVVPTRPGTGTASDQAQFGPIQLDFTDAYGNPATVASTTTLSLATSSIGTAFFSTTHNATSGGLTVSVPAGSSSSPQFYYADTQAGTPTITASMPGAAVARTTFTIKPAAAARLAIISAPSGGQHASTTASIGPFTVQRQDQYGNPVTAGTATISLSSSNPGSADFFAASAGGSKVTSIGLPAGESNANFFYADPDLGSWTLTASGVGTAGTTTVTVVP